MSKSEPFSLPHFSLDTIPAKRPETTLRTDDLFLAAYALAEGAELVRIEWISVGLKPVASFHLRSSGIRDLERCYLAGDAVANVGSLKRYLKHLKDLIFMQLRGGGRRL